MFVLIVVALVVLVLIGVVVAVLRDTEALLPEVQRDLADIGLPWEREMAPPDVAALRFSLALRGYRMSEVDEALDRLAAELEARDSTIAALRGPAPESDTATDLERPERHAGPDAGSPAQ